MNSEKTHHTKHKREFSGCVELIPPPPVLIEFVTTNRIWGFPIRQLSHFVLEDNPEHHGKRTLPPQQLILLYPDAVVILKGWRLELLLGPLVSGRVARVHAEKHLGTLMIEDAWVSEICVIPFVHISLLKNKPETPEKS
jgi:hypothetical protein